MLVYYYKGNRCFCDYKARCKEIKKIMKRIISMLLSLVMLLSMPLFSFGAPVVKTVPQPLKMKQTVTIKNLKTKEGAWKSVELTMKEVKQRSSQDPNMNVFVVEMYMKLDTFTGSKTAILSNNFPVTFIGDSNYKVDFDDMDSPLLGYAGICKSNVPYTGENYELPANDSVTLTRLGTFNILVPKNKENVVFPVLYSNGSKSLFEFNQKLLTDLSKFVLKSEAIYGSKTEGEFKTSLDLIKDSTYSETKYSKKLVLNKRTEQDKVEITTSIIGDTFDFNSETLQKTVKEEADALKYKLTQVDNTTFKLEGHKLKDQYECIIYYGCDNYYRKLEILANVKFQNKVQEVITSFSFDGSGVTIEDPKFIKAKQVNGLYAGTGKTTPFGSPVQLYWEIDSNNPLSSYDFGTKNKSVDDTMIVYENVDGNLTVSQSIVERRFILSNVSDYFSDLYKENGKDYKYFELVDFKLGVFVCHHENGKISLLILKIFDTKLEMTGVHFMAPQTESAKNILESFLKQYGYKPELANKVFDQVKKQ